MDLFSELLEDARMGRIVHLVTLVGAPPGEAGKLG